jgi:hypothetical protein
MEKDIYMFLGGKYLIFPYPFSLYVGKDIPPPSLYLSRPLPLFSLQILSKTSSPHGKP